MRYFVVVILLVCLVIPANISGVEVPIFGKGSAIDALMERAVACNLIAGGVVVIGNRDGILYTTARGTLNRRPEAPPLNERTMFDVASLTKVMATAPAVMKLVEEGKISLSDPVSRWFPEFRNPKKNDITIHHLLTHTSGLADFDLKKGAGIKTAIKKAASEKNGQRAGSCFNYADINFIILGELVYRVSGKTLDRYCSENIFAPLGAAQTMFLPPAGLRGEIAPVLGFTSGIVGDGNARRLGGVAGHAGVFSSACDIARYARLFLNGGLIDGRRVLSEGTVALMTAPNSHGNGSVVRGLGWDMESPFSAPRGNFFSKTSFGHTGYSGSSVWIDPERDLFVVVLTNRLNFYDTKTFNLFRGDVSTIAAAAFGKPGDDWLPPQGELTQMIADLLDARSRVVPASPPRVVKVAAARADKKVVAKRQVKKLVKVAKVGKDLRRKPVRSRKA